MPTLAVLPSLVFTLFLSARVTGVSILVDDASSRWTYSTPWNAITPTNPCPSCLIQPDEARAYNHTWHDTAFVNTAQLSFTGVSLDVYTICPPPLSSGAAYGTNFTFTLDNVPDGNFVGPEPACSAFTYNYLVYARRNLSLGQHVFVITNSQIDSRANTSLLLLDYAIYDDGAAATTSTPNPTSSGATASSHKTFQLPAVIASAAAAVVLLLANIALFCYYRRRRRPMGKKLIDMTEGAVTFYS